MTAASLGVMTAGEGKKGEDSSVMKKLLVLLVCVLVLVGVWRGVTTALANKKAISEVGSINSATASADLGNSQSGSNQAGSGQTGETNLTRTDGQGGVEVAVTWTKAQGAAVQKFNVQMNNHMYSLDDFDIVANSHIKVDSQDVPVSVKVDVKGGEGHHVTIEISVQSSALAQLKPGQKLTLTISNLVDVAARNFTWVN